jgi:hypothetical protein
MEAVAAAVSMAVAAEGTAVNRFDRQGSRNGGRSGQGHHADNLLSVALGYGVDPAWLNFSRMAITAPCGGEDGCRLKNATRRIKGLRPGVYYSRSWWPKWKFVLTVRG